MFKACISLAIHPPSKWDHESQASLFIEFDVSVVLLHEEKSYSQQLWSRKENETTFKKLDIVYLQSNTHQYSYSAFHHGWHEH